MKLLVFTVYMKRVGDTKEWPVHLIITEEEEEKHRQYHRSTAWNTWADRNGMYRCARLETVPFNPKIHSDYKQYPRSDEVKQKYGEVRNEVA